MGSRSTLSPITFAQSAGLLFAYYMLAPFPWQISTGLILPELPTLVSPAVDFFAMRAWRSLPTGVSASIHRVLIGLYFYDVFSGRSARSITVPEFATISSRSGFRCSSASLRSSIPLSTVTSRYRGKQRRTS